MNVLKASHTFGSGQHLEVLQGDITIEQVDAIVNAANAQMIHGGGVAAAILRQGGPEIQRESQAWLRQHGPLTHTRPAYTTAGRLPSRYVIHALGPVWGEGEEIVKLQQAIESSLAQAQKLRLASIAFPAISTGIFGFPRDLAARTFFDTIEAYYTRNSDSPLTLVRLVLFDDETVDIFTKELEQRAHRKKLGEE